MRLPAKRIAQIHIRLPPLLKEAAELAAVKDHRSLTNLIEKLLSDHIKKENEKCSDINT